MWGKFERKVEFTETYEKSIEIYGKFDIISEKIFFSNLTKYLRKSEGEIELKFFQRCKI